MKHYVGKILCKALLSEASLAPHWQLTKSIGVSSPMPALCYPTHLQLGEVNVEVNVYVHVFLKE